jgi:hypothetical protein
VELVVILRILWRRRLVVALGCVAAVAVGLTLARGTPDTAIASGALMLDTPVSQLSHASPLGADALAARAIMLGNLLATRPMEAKIAHAAGEPVDDVAVIVGSSRMPTIPTAFARHATDGIAARPEKHVVIVDIEEPLPLVSIEALAPDRRSAVGLVGAATRVAQDAAAPDSRRVVVESVGPAEARLVPGSSGRIKAVAAAIVVFALWSGGVVFASVAMRRRRGAAVALRTA